MLFAVIAAMVVVAASVVAGWCGYRVSLRYFDDLDVF